MINFGIEPTRHPLHELLNAERLAVAAGKDACGASCACHGDVVCQRAAHPHDDDQAAQHVGVDATGQLVQWVHTEQHGPMLTAAAAAQMLADTRRSHTLALLDGLDLEVLAAELERVNRKRQRAGG